MNERQIFDGALEFALHEDRLAFLDKACGDNTALRAAVDALLAAHEAPSEFLQTPAMKQLHAAMPGVERTIDHSVTRNDQDDDEEESNEITFLQPATKPGSIGRLGHYEILQVLGRGAFGIVFRAFDEKLHRQVAIKTMTPELAATSPPRKRFLREARAVAAIKHENIVQIYSVEEDPIPYLVMEFVQGQTLLQKLDGAGPFNLPEILHLGRQIAAGLAAAHAQGLIHRDIKPGNILLEQGAEQKVKITDFGLARAADDASMTRTGVISGTPLYMAPEQAMGENVDARCDLFSLGSVLYQMSTGRAAFRAGSTIAVLRRVVEDTPRDMVDVIPELPKRLVAIVMKLLAKKREERYQTAKQVCEVLTQCQQELPLQGSVTTPVPSADDSAPSNAWRTGLVALAAAILLLVGLGTAYRALAPSLSRPAIVATTVPPAIPEPHDPVIPAADPFAYPGPASPLSDSVDYAAERKAAEWVRKIGGGMTLRDPQGRELRNTSALPTINLPERDFYITFIDIGSETVDDDGLANLQGCTRLERFAIGHSRRITTRGLRHLIGNRGLIWLDVHSAAVDDGLAELLNQWPQLVVLYLGKTQTTDDLFDHCELPNLADVKFGPRTTDRGFAALLRKSPQRGALEISQDHQTTLAPLAEHESLLRIICSGKKLTEEGVAALAKNPRFHTLAWMDAIEDDTVPRLKPLAARLTYLSLETTAADPSQGLTDVGFARLAETLNVETLVIGWVGSPTDKGLLEIAKMPALKELRIQGEDQRVRITPAGTEAFRKARPDVRLIVHDRDYPAEQ